MGRCQGVGSSKPVKRAGKRTLQAEERDDRAEFRGCERAARTSLRTDEGACQSQRAMPPYCRGSKHQKNGLAPLEERKRLCDPPNLPNLISFICLFPINMRPLALFLRKEPGGLSSISAPSPKGKTPPSFPCLCLVQVASRPVLGTHFLPGGNRLRANVHRLGATGAE